MSDEGVHGAVQVERAPQQQAVLPPELRNHHGDQPVGERLQTEGSRSFRSFKLFYTFLFFLIAFLDICQKRCVFFLDFLCLGSSHEVLWTNRVAGFPHWYLAGQDVQVLPGLSEIPELHTKSALLLSVSSGERVPVWTGGRSHPHGVVLTGRGEDKLAVRMPVQAVDLGQVSGHVLHRRVGLLFRGDTRKRSQQESRGEKTLTRSKVN